MRCAVIDVGTNSVKLLVAEVQGGIATPLLETSEQTRLGEGFYKHHRLEQAAIERTAHAVNRFASQAQQRGAASTRVVATSAARDAINRQQLLDAIRVCAGLEVEVISGEQEADWVFAGVRSDPALENKPLLILDVGGGSTEFILGHGAHAQFRGSFPLGTVRLLERIGPADPPSNEDWQRCQACVDDVICGQVQPQLQAQLDHFQRGAVALVGTGGTTSILAAMELKLTVFDRVRIEEVALSEDQVRRDRQQLWGLPLELRRQLVGLPRNRADVILFGVAIFERVMDLFGLGPLRVSTRGLRFAAVLDSAAAKRQASAGPG
jgi:exopolyphosphatase/guanosine-5'-triphosphate,3'-diphosphate pyrophosphatase